MTRKVKDIAKDILSKWKTLNEHHPAYEPLTLMLEMEDLEVDVLPRQLGTNRMFICYFLGNCGTFRSSDGSAKKLKEELRQIMGFKPGRNHP